MCVVYYLGEVKFEELSIPWEGEHNFQPLYKTNSVSEEEAGRGTDEGLALEFSYQQLCRYRSSTEA